MKSMSKIALISLGLVSVTALTACQSTSSVDQKQRSHHFKKHDGHKMKHHAEHKAMHGKRMHQHAHLQKACEGKADGAVINIKMGEKELQGQCKTYFQADRQQFKGKRPAQAEQGSPRMQMRHSTSSAQNKVMTDAERAELVKKFDQRLAEKQQRQNAYLKACEGKTHGQTAQLTVGEQQVNGRCLVKFTPVKQAA